VFFATRPPAVVQDALSSPLGLAVVFGGALLVMLYHSKVVGGLLILALLLSMTKVTEHLTQQEEKELADATATVTQLQGMGLKPESNDALKNALATQARLSAARTAAPVPPPPTTTPPPPTTETTPAPSAQAAAASPPIPQPTGPAMAAPPTIPPPTSAVPPKPVMACNIENFASF
jgi:hypothetical protein